MPWGDMRIVEGLSACAGVSESLPTASTASKVGWILKFSRDSSLSKSLLSSVDNAPGHLVGAHELPVGDGQRRGLSVGGFHDRRDGGFRVQPDLAVKPGEGLG